MNIDNEFPSKWLKAADMAGKRIPVTLDRVAREEVGSDMKPVLYFQGKEKGVVLNKTNAEILKEAFGRETEEWTGKEIILTTHKVRNAEGTLVDGFTIQFPVSTALDEEVPF